jgi:hypothetical protein
VGHEAVSTRLPRAEVDERRAVVTRYLVVLVAVACVVAVAVAVAASSGAAGAEGGGSGEAVRFDFTLLHEALKENYRNYTNNVWSTITGLLVAIGWLLTSEKSRALLAGSPVARRLALATVVLVAVIHLAVLWQIQETSRSIMRSLASDPYVLHQRLSPAYYGQFQVPARHVVVSAVLDGSLFVLLLGLVYSLRDWREPGPASARPRG